MASELLKKLLIVLAGILLAAWLVIFLRLLLQLLG